MVDQDKLAGKRVLLVDDEPDILDALKELLSMCVIKTASSFEESKRLLEYSNFDIAVLDIMGVDGYNLFKTDNLTLNSCFLNNNNRCSTNGTPS